MPIYGLRFRALGQTLYHTGPADLAVGDHVLIAADQGQALAQVVSGPYDYVAGVEPESLTPIERRATEEDLAEGRTNEKLAREATEFCRQCIRDRRLDMKLVDVEVFFDRSKLIFYFTAPARIDFRELVKDLVREYRARIELRQIGVRHETQMVGAVGNCGMVCCCRRYLRKFAPVTIRMAKEQNLFLNPAKILGHLRPPALLPFLRAGELRPLPPQLSASGQEIPDYAGHHEGAAGQHVPQFAVRAQREQRRTGTDAGRMAGPGSASSRAPSRTMPSPNRRSSPRRRHRGMACWWSPSHRRTWTIPTCSPMCCRPTRP